MPKMVSDMIDITCDFMYKPAKNPLGEQHENKFRCLYDT